jgi:cell division septation protein DedD
VFPALTTGTERGQQVQPPAQPTNTTATSAASDPDKIIALINAENRIPAGEQAAIAPEETIAPINGIAYYVPDEYTYRPGTVTAATVAVAEPAPRTENALPAGTLPTGTRLSPFTAPIINGMERGSWYVQVGAFSHAESVGFEIDRIGTAYPTVVQITGTDANPVYRVLLGPLTQGESGAMLQRFKSIGYKDAFIRAN